MPMKTIGIDARFYGEAGPGRYVKAIVQHLEKVDCKDNYLIFLTAKGYDLYTPQNPNFKKVLANYKWYSFQEQFLFLAKLLKYRLNIFYVPHFNIPVLYPGTLVTAIPDLIMHTFSTEKGTTLPKPYFKFKKMIYKLVFWWAVVRSKKIIVPSKDVLKDFRRVYPQIPEDKYVLAYEGVDPDFLLADPNINPQDVLNKLQIKKPYLLYVSSAYEHKNLPNLIKAFKILLEKYSFEGQLVIVGKKDKFSEKIKELVTKEGLDNKILMPGLSNYVKDKEIVALRTQADLYVFPSLKEGFSLTPMEAQAVGLPSVISNIEVHKEIYGDSVVYFDPHNIEDIAQKINETLKSPEKINELKVKGLELIKQYSWDNTAEITYGVFDKLLQSD